MIKGHSGSGSRSAIQEDYLRLSEYRDSDIAYPSGSSTSESPHRELSEESDRGAYPLSYAPAALQYQMHVHSPDFMYPHDGWSPYHHPDFFFFNWYGIDLRSSRCVSPSNSLMMHNSQLFELDDPMSSDTFPNECKDGSYIREPCS